MFTPREGWLTLLFLLAMDLVVIVAVEQTRWVTPMPRLWAIALLGFLASLGAVKYRGPIPVQVLLQALVIAFGLGIAVLEVAGTLSGPAAAKIGEVIRRVIDWAEALTGDGISNDRLPFQIIIGLSTWVIVYLSVLFTCRFRWPWAAVIPPAIGLMTHQTYLPPHSYPVPLFFFFLFAILFMGQTNLTRVRGALVYPLTQGGARRLTPLYGLFTLTGLILAISWSLPLWEYAWQPLHDGYLATRGPYASMETGFERAFAGVPARKAGGLHTFGSALPLRGAAGTGETTVFTVVTDYPAYWRGQTYDFYQGQGWLARPDHRDLQPLSKSPLAKRISAGYKKQATIAQQVTLAGDSDVIFTGGQPSEVSIDSTVELSSPRVYSISLTAPPQPGSLPPDLFAIAQKAESQHLSARQVRAALPAGTRVVNDSPAGLMVTRDTPAVPDVLSVRGPERLKAGTTYQVLSLASIAGADDLRVDSTQYPKWVLDTYLQLPSNLPARIRALAQDITNGATNPYDKAQAIQDYLRAYKQTQNIEPPPLNADAVDYFLFTQKAGYADYFASAMTVLLRAADVPTRLTAGYSAGKFDEKTTTFTVRQSDAHSWPEVFFPTFGWIAFEPSPSLSEIGRGSLPQLLGDESGQTPEGFGTSQAEDEPEEDTSLSSFLSPGDTSLVHRLWVSTNKFLGIASAVLLGGALVIVLLLMLLWQANFIGMPYPAGMYARMALLGGLAWRGPGRQETPREYAQALSGALTLRQEQVEAISGGYTLSRYSGRDVTRDDRIAIERAWRGVRRSMLRRVAARFNLRDMLRRET